MANSGFNAEAADIEVISNFSGFDYVVVPSGSCVHHVRDNFDAIEETDAVKEVRARTYELIEFLHDILKVDAFPWARFPHRVGLHNSCGTLRQLKHATPSELREPFFSKPMDLLSKVEGIEFVTPARPDRTNAAASAVPSRCSRRSFPPRWAMTRSATTRRPAPSTSYRPTARA
jgi:L-lactate dehydrogenase complex protein LldE